MMAREFTVGQGYTIDGAAAFYLGAADGINLFLQRVEQRLHLFAAVPATAATADALQETVLDIYREDELAEVVPVTGALLNVDTDAVQRFLLTEQPALPNTAFCPAGRLADLAQPRGEVRDATADLTLGKRYRAVAPDYCVVQGETLWRQTGLREQYPDLVLQLVPFPRAAFLARGEFADGQPVYVRAKSVEKYGGKHAQFAEWAALAKQDFAAQFAGAQLATWARRYALTDAGRALAARLAVAEADIKLLLPSI